MKISTLSFFGFITAAAMAVGGCEEEKPDVVQQIRAIKTHIVTEVSAGETRRFSGRVEATNSSTLSFQVSGNVKEMRVNQGDMVERGQVLAVLDSQPYELDVQSAKADLQNARAEYTRARAEYTRQETLFKNGWVAEARLDVFKQARDSATSAVDFAVSKLKLAERDLRLTELTAPFKGPISRKYIDAFVEVTAGKPVYEIEASGGLEVRFDISETAIARISLGMPATVRFPTEAGSNQQGRITEIGSSAGEANAFPVKAALDDPPSTVRSGMTAEVTILLKKEGADSAYLVPLAAVYGSQNQGEGYVFVYDATTETVRRTLVKGRGGIDEFVHIFEGLESGDIIAAAGVSFLTDGQKVKLMQPRSPNALGARAVKK
jgi:RND family efflux transporter MFP subunit